jgi:hypothetical protein
LYVDPPPTETETETVTDIDVQAKRQNPSHIGPGDREEALCRDADAARIAAPTHREIPHIER